MAVRVSIIKQSDAALQYDGTTPVKGMCVDAGCIYHQAGGHVHGMDSPVLAGRKMRVPLVVEAGEWVVVEE